MAVKETGIAGSAIGAIILALLVLRVPGRAPAPKSESPASTSAGAHEKQPKEVPNGPWLASRNHFAGISPQCGGRGSVAGPPDSTRQSSGAASENTLNA